MSVGKQAKQAKSQLDGGFALEIELPEGTEEEDEHDIARREAEAEDVVVAHGVTTSEPMRKAAHRRRGPRPKKRGARSIKMNFHAYPEVRVVADDLCDHFDVDHCVLYERALGALAREERLKAYEKRLERAIKGELVERDGYLVERR